MTDTPHAQTGALITGGAQGLGLAIAEQLVAEGCRRLVLVDRNATAGQQSAAALRARGIEAAFLHIDMADIPAVQTMVAQAAAQIGAVTALVNGAASTERGSILDTTPERWDALMTPNAKAPFFALQAFAQHCIANGHPGACVNILSIVVHGGTSVLAPYVASKAALAGVTKNAAAALTKHRIRVNGINVGWMDTPGEDQRQRQSHDRPEGWLAGVEANMPFGMLVKPEHVARQASFLLGPQSGVVTGALMDFDQHVVGAYPDTDDS